MSADDELDTLLRGLGGHSGPSLTVDLVATRLFGLGAPRIGRFEIREILGEGGTATVYLAEDLEAAEGPREVALKLMTSPREADQARLAREARVAAKLDHPNLVRVIEQGLHAGQVYLAMERIEGQALDRWLRAEPRAWEPILDVFLAAGEGLAAAHAAGILHRDFKPANVVVDLEGRARVIDFGLARPRKHSDESSASSFHYSITTSNQVSGTLAYMAPELLRGAEPSERSDIYAFCLTMLEASCLDPDLGHSLPHPLVEILRRGRDPDTDRRWPAMRPLLDALRDQAEPLRTRRGRLLGQLGAALRRRAKGSGQ